MSRPISPAVFPARLYASAQKDIGEYRFRDVVVPHGISAIVPEDLFERVQEKIEKNKKAPSPS